MLAACGGGASAPNPPPPPPAAPVVTTVEVTPANNALFSADTVRLAVRALDQHGAALSGKTFSWSSGAAGIATVTGEGLVTGVGAGSAVISASVDGKTGSATLAVRSADSLPGAPGDPAVAAIRDLPFTARPQDYATDNLQLPGVTLSFNTVTVTIVPTATIAAVNALLTQFAARIVGGVPGKAAAAAGILMLRLPVQSHLALTPRLDALRQSTLIGAATPDIALEPEVIPASNGGAPPEWMWTLTPSAGAWGAIAIRAPEMWNLNAAIERAGSHTLVGIFDNGFASHSDLAYSLGAGVPVRLHGTHVAGTIAAIFGNRRGIDGINPFATLVVEGGVTFATLISGLEALILTRPDVRVINLSLGYNWGSPPPPVINTNGPGGAGARQQADDDGAILTTFLQTVAQASRPLPVIVAAAGNDSDTGPGGVGDQEAEYASPFNNAALAHHAAPIIVVEAVGLGAGGSLSRATFSNVGGHVSAPGVAIQSTGLANDYAVLSGTSMATPHVTGLVSYLYALDPSLPAPTMTTNPLRDLLMANAVPAFGGVAKLIDGFATALDLDRINGNHKVLALLVDVDDGTLDGNTRVNPPPGNSVNTVDAKGDGHVNMADFRRWRDWLLQAEDGPNLSLDGAAAHPKRDLNGDGSVSALAAVENIHPRGDFNGDGAISRTQKVKVPGVKGGATLVTDLEVLQELFQDADYQPADLAALQNSWDLDLNPVRCKALPGAVSVRTTVKVQGQQAIVATRTHTGASLRHIITLPVLAAGHEIRVDALDAAGNTIASQQETVGLNPGADFYDDPACIAFELSVVFPTTVTAGTPATLDVLAGERDLASGVVTGKSGIAITVVPVGGTVAPTSGLTIAGGHFIATATLTPGNTVLSLAITATRQDGVTLLKNVSASDLTPPPPPPPPPPPGPCNADVLVQSDAQATALADSTCLNSLFINGTSYAQPVQLDKLLEVKDGFRVTALLPGLSFAKLAKVGGGARLEPFGATSLDLTALTDVDGGMLVDWFSIVGSPPGLQQLHFGNVRLDGGLTIRDNPNLALLRLGSGSVLTGGPLVISNNAALTDLNFVACGIHITGNLEIKNNTALSTAAAQAKASCLVVTGTTTITGNKLP